MFQPREKLLLKLTVAQEKQTHGTLRLPEACCSQNYLLGKHDMGPKSEIVPTPVRIIYHLHFSLGVTNTRSQHCVLKPQNTSNSTETPYVIAWPGRTLFLRLVLGLKSSVSQSG